MGDGVLAFYFFECGEVVGVGVCLCFEYLVVDSSCELSADDVCQYFALCLPVWFDGYGF